MDQTTSMPRTIPGLKIFDKWLERSAILLGGLLLIGLVGLTVTNTIVMRKILNDPIRGAEDLLVLMLMTLVAISIPFGGRAGAHIEIEIVTDMLGKGFTRSALLLTRFLGFGFIALMSWRLWVTGQSADRLGEVTQQLEISYEPFYYGLSICFALLAVTQIIDILQLTLNGAIETLSEDMGEDEVEP
jgi:TRAP-type C4-dicarboxylate transport system permease small subunit